MFKYLKEDIKAVKERDPAAPSALEVMLLYPSVKAMSSYRISHFLWKHGFRFFARAISQRAVRKTGIEIHPGAEIGRRFFIDHGSGVVIGETAQIGNDVTVYQGVTLGGTGKDCGKRHPTIGNNVLIGAGAKLLGPFQVGDNTNIAAGAVVLKDIPENSTAVGVPARVVKQNGKKVENIDQIHIPDPVASDLIAMDEKVRVLQTKLKTACELLSEADLSDEQRKLICNLCNCDKEDKHEDL